MANHNIHDALDGIRADEQLKESTRYFLSQQRAGGLQPYRRPAFRGILAAVCALVLLAAGAGGYSWVQTPVSYVSIDVNPSIELALNRLDRVASVTAFNEQGARITQGMSLKGKKYTDALDALLASSEMERYLADDAELVFTVASDARGDALLDGIGHCGNHSEHRCESVSADVALVAKAHENGLSLGKYYAYLQLAAYDSTVTVDDCRDMDISEIHRCIRAHGRHEQEEDSGTADCQDDDVLPEGMDVETDADAKAPAHHGGHGHGHREHE